MNWPNQWHWLILGGALAVAEMVVPGVFLLWLGVAAVATGVVVAAVPGLSWQVQGLIFAVLAVASGFIGRQLYRRAAGASDHPALNRRGQQYIGQIVTLEQPIRDGAGRVRVADTTWKVTGPDASAGSRVRVVGVDGPVLKVEPLD